VRSLLLRSAPARESAARGRRELTDLRTEPVAVRRSRPFTRRVNPGVTAE